MSNVGRHWQAKSDNHRYVHSGAYAMELTAVLTHAEEGGFIALNPETGTTTQGETVEEAIANLREATALYLSEFPLPATGHPLVTMFTVPESAAHA
jgi:predicted RNase H-like HicB family nuclease